MRPVYALSGGVSKFSKARPDKTFQAVVKEAYDYAISDIGLDFPTFTSIVDGSVASYFSDHFSRQLMAGIMAQDYLGLCPKPSHRVEGGGATGGLCFQEAWKAIASGHMDVCIAYGFETMSHVETWKGNEFIALASDVSWDYPVGGFYSGYYAMMVTRHMKEYGTTVEQMAHVSVKNHINAYYNPYAQKRNRYSVDDVRNAPMVAWPLTRPMCSPIGDGAAAAIICSEDFARKAQPQYIAEVAACCLASGEDREAEEETTLSKLAKKAYEKAGIGPEDLSLAEVHDATAFGELSSTEQIGICPIGEGGRFAEAGHTTLGGKIPVNVSGGLESQGHPVGATGVAHLVEITWQLRGEAGARQIDRAKVGYACNFGGFGNNVIATVLQKEAK